MPVTSVLAFWGVATLLILVPGPDWAFAISAGLRRRVVAAAAGIVLGYAVMTVVVAGGVGVLVARSPGALTVLTVAGGLYLVWLGARTTLRPAAPHAAAAEAADGARAVVLRGMAVSGLNPKALLMFVALLPQFATPERPWPVPVQLAALGATFTLTCGVTYLAVGTVARALSLARPAAAHLVSRISGAAMVVLGVAVLVEHGSHVLRHGT